MFGYYWIYAKRRGRKDCFGLVALFAATPTLAPHPADRAQDSTGTTNRISVSSDGAQGNDDSWEPALSADGRFVAFVSEASNLVTRDTNDDCSGYKGADDFVHDRQTGTTSLVAVSSDGTHGTSATARAAPSNI